jgi:hypothetical protein
MKKVGKRESGPPAPQIPQCGKKPDWGNILLRLVERANDVDLTRKPM